MPFSERVRPLFRIRCLSLVVDVLPEVGLSLVRRVSFPEVFDHRVVIRIADVEIVSRLIQLRAIRVLVVHPRVHAHVELD